MSADTLESLEALRDSLLEDADPAWQICERFLDFIESDRDRLAAELARVREERDDMANAVRFLAKQEARTFEIRATAIRMLAKGEIEEAKDLVIMKWPIVQGIRNQIDLATVGNQPCDLKRVRPAIEVLLRSALAKPQDGTTEGRG